MGAGGAMPASTPLVASIPWVSPAVLNLSIRAIHRIGADSMKTRRKCPAGFSASRQAHSRLASRIQRGARRMRPVRKFSALPTQKPTPVTPVMSPRRRARSSDWGAPAIRKT